eukprot:GHVP01022222.1.p1 GENE.GHVP01022222.1~~GHVP01022222.1.p1  ORF type:complete len:252 (+),score=37.18 GHVP01022222.1:786-1541(+)
MRPPFQLSNGYEDGPTIRKSKPLTLLPVDTDGPINLLVRDPEVLGKTWTVEVAPEATIAEVIHLFLSKMGNHPIIHGCQLRLMLGNVALHEELDRTLDSFGITRLRSLLSSSWKASASGCVTQNCQICNKIRNATPRRLATAAHPRPNISKAQEPTDQLSVENSIPQNSPQIIPGSKQEAPRRKVAAPKAGAPVISGPQKLISDLEKLVNSAYLATDVAGQLERLSILKREGSINEEEFQLAKKKVLGLTG